MSNLKCILLVDDNVDDNFFHTIAIRNSHVNAEIKTATNGERALEYLAKTKEDPSDYPFPDLIFLDINMPRINGFEFLERARAANLFDHEKSVIVVMLTSSLNPSDEEKAKENFADLISGFMNKPLTADMMREIAGRYFNGG